MLNKLRNWTSVRFRHWLKKRLPAARTLTLNGQRLFIFPSRTGFGFILLLLLILLVAINSQNNIIFAIAFLLSSLVVVTILHTWMNLHGLTFSNVRSRPVFAAESACFEIRVSRPSNSVRHAITLGWPHGDAAQVSLLAESETAIELLVPTRRRGYLKPGRLLIESSYPLGLIRCWSWVDLEFEALVYPQPLEGAMQSGNIGESESGEILLHLAGDDYYGLREYQPGDSLKQVAWKQFARGHALHTRQFAAYRDHQLWLDYDSFTGGVERRLSAICFEVMRVDAMGESYGLRLPGVEIAPAAGDRHREQVLRSLALFEAGDNA